MKFLPLVFRNLSRRKTRTVFTVLSVFIAFFLYGVLVTLRVAFSYGVEVAGADRLVMIHKVSLIMPLPISYQKEIQGAQGVSDVAHATMRIAATMVLAAPAADVQPGPRRRIAARPTQARLAETELNRLGNIFFFSDVSIPVGLNNVFSHGKS